MRLRWLWAILAVYFLVFWYAVGDLGLAFACTAFFTFVLTRYSLAVMAHSLGHQSLPDQTPPPQAANLDQPPV